MNILQRDPNGYYNHKTRSIILKKCLEMKGDSKKKKERKKGKGKINRRTGV